MAKQKLLELLSAPITKKKRSGAAEVDSPGDNGWVVIKKQKITIIIPALPVPEQNITQDEQSLPVSPRNSASAEVECSDASYSESEQHLISEREKTLSPAPESPLPAVNSVPQRRSVSCENPEINNVRSLPLPIPIRTVRVRNQALLVGDGMSVLCPRMRAFNIDKKLKRAGGLDRWLVSLGLQRFVKMFRQRNVNKFQLANLTMSKLKDMGVHAVGPRRKLMHAMDCLCQPYCFERF